MEKAWFISDELILQCQLVGRQSMRGHDAACRHEGRTSRMVDMFMRQQQHRDVIDPKADFCQTGLRLLKGVG